MSDIGKIQPVEITEEIKKSYLDYAMSVIVARALPDVRDGLKPVHRRILYAMQQMGLSWPSRFTKAAKIVGETLGKYHPHGDMSVYDTLVRLAQDFSMRYPLINGQGNFGSVDGDPPAAMRYTEARLASITSEMLADIEKNTVEWRDNFDGTLKEPTYLPAKLPNLLLMGSEGIAVGMATKIPPHNLKEVVDALVFTIDKGKVISSLSPLGVSFDSPVTVEDLMQFIKGPDFPTGATIWNYQDIFQAYATGRGKILIRAIANIEESGSKMQIVVTKIPYQVNKAGLVAHVAHLVRDKKIEGISDLRDESDRQGLRIVIELKKNAKSKVILNNLFKHTAMQTVYPVNTVVLVDGTPQTLNLKQILIEFIKHRQQIVTRRTIFDLEAARARVHILEGLKIALDNLDAVIQTIKRSADEKTARINLMAKFSLSELQSNAILEMQLRRLAALERKKIEDEYQQVGKLIQQLLDLLASPKKVLKIIKEELLKIKDLYGDERRTKVYRQKVGEFSEKDLVPNELCLITVTRTGYIKRLAPITYRSQRRGGKGVAGMTTKETDEVKTILSTNTHDQILFFTNRGRVFAIPAWEIPEASRISKGQAIINLINVGAEEQIQAILNLTTHNFKHLLMVTKKGVVKKTSLAHFQNIRSSGLIAIKLEKDDELCWVKQTTGNNHVLLVTHLGKSIRFQEADVRPTGRDTIGVRGIRLQKDDCVIGMEVFEARPPVTTDKRRKFFRDVLVVMERGLGKRTGIRAFPLQKRGGIGVKAAHVTPKTGQIIVSQFVDQDTDLVVLTSKKAQIIKLPLKNIPRLGRDTQGVILMRFSKTDDHVAAVTCMGK